MYGLSSRAQANRGRTLRLVHVMCHLANREHALEPRSRGREAETKLFIQYTLLYGLASREHALELRARGRAAETQLFVLYVCWYTFL